MPEYVYALHDFSPEHEDEISFRAGEKIEVVEKDDEFGDGWWSGKNIAGKTGLFPQSYTSPQPPAQESNPPDSNETSSSKLPTDSAPTSSSQLHPLREESESEPASERASPAIPHTTPPAIQLNGSDTPSEHPDGEGEVMLATMSDVQRAIEQLGRRRANTNDDGARSMSFSFASERDTEADTDDTDLEHSDIDGNGARGEDWHKGARQKLAEKARRAVEEAEKMEQMMLQERSTAPPIEVEMSDESEGEEEDMTNRFRTYRSIPEEDEDEVAGNTTISQDEADQSINVTIPTGEGHGEVETATATRTSFPPITPPPLLTVNSFTETSSQEPTPLAPVPSTQSTIFAEPEPHRQASPAPLRESFIALPSSPAPSSNGANTVNGAGMHSKHSSISSSARMTSPQFPSVSTAPTSAISQLNPSPFTEDKPRNGKKETTHVNDWSVEDVIDWLQSKGFDQDVCDKFTEQEITGDVLLDLDVNLLKSEIGIMAFGKRVRIANAITDLRRPPSINYSDNQSGPSSPWSLHYQHMQNQQNAAGSNIGQQNSNQVQQTMPSHHLHSRTASFGQSVHSSLNSPIGYAGGSGLSAIISPESPLHAGDIPGSPLSPLSRIANATTAATAVTGPGSEAGASSIGGQHEPIGLGIAMSTTPPPDSDLLNGNSKAQKNRPAQLTLSPSDGALSATARAVSAFDDDDDDKAIVSESEVTASKSMRRRLFGRSQDSSSLKDKASPISAQSKEGSDDKTIPSPLSSSASPVTEKDKTKNGSDVAPKSHTRARRSVDKSSDRLSLFGGISGGLGKNRKPAPRYPSNGGEEFGEKNKEKEKDKHPSMSLSRLYGSSSGRKSGRPSTADGSKPSPKEFKSQDIFPSKETTTEKDTTKVKDPQLLRKRASSATTTMPETAKGTSTQGPSLKVGQSILEQIGEPDHNGWMRKKGDRYNNWKLRYFVLKGPHLYCLRSNSKTETKIKGYVNIVGYKVVVDENVNPGRYGFRIVHDHDKTHAFSSEDKSVIRDWMKAIMKATIGRDYTKAVVSSYNIPTIPLTVAQAMNPAPRPPSPTARDATQKALRRENPNQLSSRDARILMGLPSSNELKDDRTKLGTVFSATPIDDEDAAKTNKAFAPPRPSREMRRNSIQHSISASTINVADESLIDWANTHLPSSLQIIDTLGPLFSGLALLRLAESIKGRPSSPPVPDSAFPVDPSDDKLDGLFRLFDFLLDNDVKMGSVSINDVRQGKREKVIQLLRALKSWEDKRRALTQSIGNGSVQAGAFMAPVGMHFGA